MQFSRTPWQLTTSHLAKLLLSLSLHHLEWPHSQNAWDMNLPNGWECEHLWSVFGHYNVVLSISRAKYGLLADFMNVAG